MNLHCIFESGTNSNCPLIEVQHIIIKKSFIYLFLMFSLFMQPPVAEMNPGSSMGEEGVILNLKRQLAERDSKISQLKDQLKQQDEEILLLRQRSVSDLPFSVGKNFVSL